MKNVWRVALLTSITLFPCLAVEEQDLSNVSSIQNNEVKNKWIIDNTFHKALGEGHEVKIMVIKSNNPEIFFQDITLEKNNNQVITISLYARSALQFTGKTNCNLLKNLRETTFQGWGEYCGGGKFSSLDQTKIGEFLSVFYEKNLIDDFVIEIIKENLKKRNVPFYDFRPMTTEKMINLINESMGEEPSADKCREIAFEELNKIVDPVRKQTIIWDLVKTLEEDQPVLERNLVIDLLKLITDQSLPFYSKARLKIGNLQATDEKSSLSSLDRSRLNMSYILPVISQEQEAYQQQIRLFRYDYTSTITPIPPALDNFDGSSQSVINLIEHALNQEKEINKLKKENDDLKKKSKNL